MRWFPIVFPAMLAFGILGLCPAQAQHQYDGYFHYLEDFPAGSDRPYGRSVQGISHDDDFWYITNDGRLYKIDVLKNLSVATADLQVTVSQTGLNALGYTKFKALDSYRNPFDGQWYLVIGVEGAAAAGFAVFDTALQLKGAVPLSQPAAGWVAIDNAGQLYSGYNDTSFLFRYSLDWQGLASTGTVDVTTLGLVDLLDEAGNPLEMDHFQGGDFTPEGDKLYITSGFFDISSAPHGIHAFDAATSTTAFQRIRKSGQSGLFEFRYNPSFPYREEPEGITFWDLTDGRAPNIDGELHVLLLDNNAPNNDEFFLKHYTKGIYIDAAAGIIQLGTAEFPLATVGSGAVAAFDEMELRIVGGNYPETLYISKRIQLLNITGSGVVTIGQ